MNKMKKQCPFLECESLRNIKKINFDDYVDLKSERCTTFLYENCLGYKQNKSNEKELEGFRKQVYDIYGGFENIIK